MSSSSPKQSSHSRKNSNPAANKIKRISKDEKIDTLKSDLKISKAENARLRKELERLKRSTHGPTLNSSDSGTNANTNTNPQPPALTEEQKKFREAMRALKQVTVSQERCIKTLRAKAKERRRDLKDKDAQIKALEQKIKSFQTADRLCKKNGGDKDALQSKLKDLQFAHDGLVQRTIELEEELDEKESQLESLAQSNKEHHPDSALFGGLHRRNNTPSDGESVGSASLQSNSTAADFDVARLKTELAQKADKIVNLQMQLETVKEQLYQARQQTNSKTDDDDPFIIGTNSFSPQAGFGQQASGDEWTDAEETDNELEFGEMQSFGESFFKQTKETDFW